MTIKNQSNAELIKICEKAKTLLWTGNGPQKGKHVWVCGALSSASPRCTPVKLEQLVKRHIGSHTFMTGFLRAKFGQARFSGMTQPQIQAWRFLMLNNMIKILEAEGKKA